MRSVLERGILGKAHRRKRLVPYPADQRFRRACKCLGGRRAGDDELYGPGLIKKVLDHALPALDEVHLVDHHVYPFCQSGHRLADHAVGVQLEHAQEAIGAVGNALPVQGQEQDAAGIGAGRQHVRDQLVQHGCLADLPGAENALRNGLVYAPAQY